MNDALDALDRSNLAAMQQAKAKEHMLHLAIRHCELNAGSRVFRYALFLDRHTALKLSSNHMVEILANAMEVYKELMNTLSHSTR
jgi:hypothetical protein